MTWFHGCQIAIALVGIVIGTRQLRVMLFRNGLLPEPFLAAFRVARQQAPDRAAALAEEGGEAWVARVAAVGLAEERGQAPPGALAELTFDLRTAAVAGIRPLRTIGRASSPLAFIGVIVELGIAFHGEHGLAALQRGLVEQRAMQHAIVGLSIGIVVSVCAFVAAATLVRLGRAQLSALRKACALFEGEAGPEHAADVPTAPVSRAET